MKDKERQIEFEKRVQCGIAYCEDPPFSEIEQDFKTQEEKCKQIEELANILCDRCMEINKSSACPYYDERSCFENRKKEATYYYEQGYRKINKDSVVLSRKKYFNLIHENYFLGQDEIRFYYQNIKIPQERKETTEKDFNLIIRALEERKERVKSFYGVDESVGVDIAIRIIKVLAKQYDVEIKE